jgi:hypothetical protein
MNAQAVMIAVLVLLTFTVQELLGSDKCGAKPGKQDDTRALIGVANSICGAILTFLLTEAGSVVSPERRIGMMIAAVVCQVAVQVLLGGEMNSTKWTGVSLLNTGTACLLVYLYLMKGTNDVGLALSLAGTAVLTLYTQHQKRTRDSDNQDDRLFLVLGEVGLIALAGYSFKRLL